MLEKNIEIAKKKIKNAKLFYDTVKSYIENLINENANT